MNCKPNARKLVQVCEEAQRPVYVPVVIGNECFVITQQDVRRIEDMRLLSYSKLTPNGQLIPMEILGHDGHASDAVLQAYRIQQQQQQHQYMNMPFGHSTDSQFGVCNLNTLADLVGRFYATNGKTPSDIKMQDVSISPMPAACMPATQTMATLEQQLQWAKANPNSSSPYPLTYSTGTSTSELKLRARSNQIGHCCCCGCKCPNNKPHQTAYTTRACNTMDVDDDNNGNGQQPTSGGGKSAREQLKQKKMSKECL